MWIGRRPADDAKTYGYRRWEILAALVNGAALFGIAGWIVVEAIERLGQPPAIRTGLMAGVAAVGLATNAIALLLLHRDGKESLNARAAYLHVMADLLGSLGALAAAGIIVTTGWTPADPILSIALALLILVGAWRLVRESTDVLLEAVPRGISMAEVQRRVQAVAGVAAVHDLRVWTVTSGVVAMSGHAIVPNLGAHPGVLDDIRKQMGELGIGHVTIQLEVEDHCAEEPGVAPADPHGHGHLHHHHHH
jgi:cobalt-zinc-cadmium efflux system protein